LECTQTVSSLWVYSENSLGLYGLTYLYVDYRNFLFILSTGLSYTSFLK